MLTLLKTLDSDWVVARQTLTADLTTIETILNRRWGQTFGSTNVLQVPGGGTGISSFTLGDTLYASAATTLSKLAGNITTTRKFLRQVGTGTVSAAPAWDTITNADIPGAAFTKTDDTNVTATLTGTPTTAVLRAMNFALGWVGQLGLSRGGTNADLSLTGGTSFVLRQSSAGAAITVSQLAASDLSNGTTGSGAVVLAVSPALTSVPTAPTAAPGTNTTQLATTAFVTAAVGTPVTSITGTANQITASSPTGAVTLSLAGPHNFTTQTIHGVLLGQTTGAITATAAGASNTVLHGNTGADPTFSAVSLTADVSGTLPVGNGGTGTATAFTLGSVVFAGASGVYTQDNANFFWDATGKRLGLGITTGFGSSNTILAVYQPTGTKSAVIEYGVNGTSVAALVGAEGAAGSIVTGSSERDFSWRIVQPRSILFSTDNGASIAVAIDSSGRVNIGNSRTATAVLQLKAGTATASTAPLKFTSGTNLTSAEAGAMEFTTDDLFFTITTGAARKGIILNNGSNLTSGSVPIATTNGRLIDSFTLPVSVTNGGIGVGTLASNGVLYGNGTSAVQALAVNSTATNKFLTQVSSGAPAWNTIAAGDVPNLPASILTSGQLALARGGTNADLSATGGASQVLKQTSVGGAVTVAQLTTSDISGYTAPVLTLLAASSGTSSSTSAVNLATVALSGLTAKDIIIVEYQFAEITANSGTVSLYSNTDSGTLLQLASALGPTNTIIGTARIMSDQTSTSAYDSWASQRANGSLDVNVGQTQFAATTAFTGSWTLALRSGGVVATGTLQWRWNVYKLAGQ